MSGCLQAATRGDGKVGEDAMCAAQHCSGLPKQVPTQVPFTVRGELHITRKDFAEVNAKRTAAGLQPFATARNAAAGAARLEAQSEIEQRRLSFVAFQLIEMARGAAELHSDGMRRLADWGFATVATHGSVAKNIDEAVSVGHELLAQREELPYETDGVVLKTDSLKVCPGPASWTFLSSPFWPVSCCGHAQ